MKKFKESTLNYRCTGCGVSIYNATHNHNLTCPECGGKLMKVKEKKNEDRFCRPKRTI